MVPRVSVVIPTFNRPTLLRRAVISALAAVGAGGDVVVIDDGSEVPAAEVLADLAGPRLTVLRNAEGKGASAARNFGVRQARGDVIFFLDDDDELLPDYIARVDAETGGFASAAFGYSAYMLRSPASEEADVAKLDRTGLIDPTLPLRKRLIGLCMGVWMHRGLFLEAGGLDPALTIDEDTDLTIRLFDRRQPGWFDGRPGVAVDRRAQDGLTATVAPMVAARSYVSTYLKNAARLRPGSPDDRFLSGRALRRAGLAGALPLAREVLARTRHPLTYANGVAVLGATLAKARLRGPGRR